MPNTGGVTFVDLGDEVLGDKKYQEALDKSLAPVSTADDIKDYADEIVAVSAEDARKILANGREL